MDTNDTLLNGIDGLSAFFGNISDESRNLQIILDTIPSSVVIIDSEGRFIYVNKRGMELYGIDYTGSEMDAHMAKIKALRLNGAPFSLEEMPVSRSIRSGQIIRNVEMIIENVNGVKYPVNVSSAPLHDQRGEINGAIVIFEDITERKRAEDALQESQSQLEAVFKSMNEGVIISDPHGNILSFNDAASKVHRYKDAGEWRRNLYDFPDTFTLYDLDGSPMPVEEWPLSHVLRGETFTGMEVEVRKKDTGNIGIWSYGGVPIRDADNNIRLAVLTVEDITERKRAEEALHHSKQKALALVRELEEADRNKNRFIGALSHELRNPLAVISAGLHLLDITNDEGQIHKTKNTIHRQMNQLCALVDDLLDLTRITHNKIILKKERMELNSLTVLTAEEHQFLFEEKGINLYIETSADPVYMNADPVRIKQIVGNLLHNAKKYTGTGGETVLTIYKEEQEAVISVKDNGIGISQEMADKLFQPFMQADMPSDRSGGGLGLGLSITKGIAELHGGSVGAYSEGPGKGSEFMIRLPLSIDHIDDRPGGADPEDAGPGARKVLIIEDNKDFADLLSAMLTAIGYRAEVAWDGYKGLKKARRFRPDIVFCDIGLPGMHGYAVAEKIRNDDVLKAVYLIALSGYAGAPDVEKAIKAGYDRHLAKPVGIDILKKVLQEL